MLTKLTRGRFAGGSVGSVSKSFSWSESGSSSANWSQIGFLFLVVLQTFKAGALKEGAL
jgi:hypothetical protein